MYQGYRARRLPYACIGIRFGDFSFYYGGGLFFDYVGGYYVSVRAPVGAVVPILPAGYRVSLVGGATYYTVNDTYYYRVPNGYVVVPDPAVQVVDVSTAYESVEEAVYTVWIPNENGSRTPVDLRETQDGQWIGPSGEYYAEFPTVEQLEPVYGLRLLRIDAAEEGPAGDGDEVVIWIRNDNGSRTPIILTPTDDGFWIGPQGEVYDELPGEEQLLPVYGIHALSEDEASPPD